MRTLADLDQTELVTSVLDNLHNLEGIVPDIDTDELKSWPVDKLYRFLGEERLALPNKENAISEEQFSRLDSVFLPLTKVIRDMDVIGPLESPWILPTAYDVMITDISPLDLKTNVSAALKIDYLSRVLHGTGPMWPLKGIIYGNNSRVMVSAVVECRRPNQEITRCNVHFLFDTGAPATYLTKEAFEALGVNDPKIDGTMTFMVNGKRMPVSLSQGHFKDVNILGMNFLDRTSASLKLSFVPDEEGHQVLLTTDHQD